MASGSRAAPPLPPLEELYNNELDFIFSYDDTSNDS
jgi:hypothetical protein